jgi:nucleoside 2-deoxyribosyltransferase
MPTGAALVPREQCAKKKALGLRGDAREALLTPRKIYLAGPEVFRPDAVEAGRRKQTLCREFGFEGLYPLDTALPDGDWRDERIYAANLALIRQAEAAVFNLTPFRGVNADLGTAFELGFCVALGKPVFAYTHDPEDYFVRVREAFGAHQTQDGLYCDAHGLEIENFGNADNLMLDAALKSQGRAVLRGADKTPPDDLALFVACLRQALLHFGS